MCVRAVHVRVCVHDLTQFCTFALYGKVVVVKYTNIVKYYSFIHVYCLNNDSHEWRLHAVMLIGGNHSQKYNTYVYIGIDTVHIREMQLS